MAGDCWGLIVHGYLSILMALDCWGLVVHGNLSISLELFRSGC